MLFIYFLSDGWTKLSVFDFSSNQKRMKLFTVVDLFRAPCCTTQSLHCSCRACRDFWGLWALLTGAFVRLKRIREDWQLGFFPSFIVSSAYRLLQWGKLIMSSTHCFTPPTTPFIQIITLGNHNEFVADHFGCGERKGGVKKKNQKSPFPSLTQAAGNYRRPFDP